MYKKLQDSKREIKDICFDSKAETGVLDIFEGVKSDVMYIAQYDENSDIGARYLGMPKMRKWDELKAEHKAPIREDCYIPGKLLACTDCRILLHTEASQLLISRTFYLNYPSLYSLPKFVSKTENILVDNGQFIGILSVIPVVSNLQRHRFEVYTLVSEIHDNVHMVMGIKNVYKR